MPAGHYEVLGVARDAAPDEIKRAYRTLAREHHPDANSGDPDATERFKEITRAYEVLSDPEKKQRYDMFGHERAGASGFGDFAGASDLFSAFFGGSRGATRRGERRGADLLAEVEISLEDAALGAEREVEIGTLGECPKCGGNGAQPGTSPDRCSGCGGSGEVRQARRTFLGDIVTASACPRCGGSGEEIPYPCDRCAGHGRVEVTDAITLRIPPGVDDGAQLRVSGRGQAAPRGGRTGDLYVEVRVTPHEVFRRAGDDLGCEISVPMTVAALGGEIEIPTLEGAEEVSVEAGTQTGEVKRLRGLGMPRLDGRGRGQLVALLRVQTPTGLDSEQAELLARLAELRGEETGQRGFFEKIKEAFK